MIADAGDLLLATSNEFYTSHSPIFGHTFYQSLRIQFPMLSECDPILNVRRLPLSNVRSKLSESAQVGFWEEFTDVFLSDPFATALGMKFGLDLIPESGWLLFTPPAGDIVINADVTLALSLRDCEVRDYIEIEMGTLDGGAEFVIEGVTDDRPNSVAVAPALSWVNGQKRPLKHIILTYREKPDGN